MHGTLDEKKKNQQFFFLFGRRGTPAKPKTVRDWKMTQQALMETDVALSLL
jgi:hypothetical protein